MGKKLIVFILLSIIINISFSQNTTNIYKEFASLVEQAYATNNYKDFRSSYRSVFAENTIVIREFMGDTLKIDTFFFKLYNSAKGEKTLKYEIKYNEFLNLDMYKFYIGVKEIYASTISIDTIDQDTIYFALTSEDYKRGEDSLRNIIIKLERKNKNQKDELIRNKIEKFMKEIDKRVDSLNYGQTISDYNIDTILEINGIDSVIKTANVFFKNIDTEKFFYRFEEVSFFLDTIDTNFYFIVNRKELFDYDSLRINIKKDTEIFLLTIRAIPKLDRDTINTIVDGILNIVLIPANKITNNEERDTFINKYIFKDCEGSYSSREYMKKYATAGKKVEKSITKIEIKYENEGNYYKITLEYNDKMVETVKYDYIEDKSIDIKNATVTYLKVEINKNQ